MKFFRKKKNTADGKEAGSVTNPIAVYHMVSAKGEVLTITNPDTKDDDNAKMPDDTRNKLMGDAVPPTIRLHYFYNTSAKTDRCSDLKKGNEWIAKSLKHLANTNSKPLDHNGIRYENRENAFQVGKLHLILSGLYDKPALAPEGDASMKIHRKSAQKLLEKISAGKLSWSKAKTEVNDLFNAACMDKFPDQNFMGRLEASGWLESNTDYMTDVWVSYLEEHPETRSQVETLLKAGVLPIEDSPHDKIWGVGPDPHGIVPDKNGKMPQPGANDSKLLLTEVILRAACRVNQVDYPEAWFNDVRDQFNANIKLTTPTPEGERRPYLQQNSVQVAEIDLSPAPARGLGI